MLDNQLKSHSPLILPPRVAISHPPLFSPLFSHLFPIYFSFGLFGFFFLEEIFLPPPPGFPPLPPLVIPFSPFLPFLFPPSFPLYPTSLTPFPLFPSFPPLFRPFCPSILPLFLLFFASNVFCRLLGGRIYVFEVWDKLKEFSEDKFEEDNSRGVLGVL